MALAPVGGEAALGAWTLVAALGFVVCAGLLWTWRNTIGAAFEQLASFRIGLKYVGSIHPLAPLGSINNAVEHNLSVWADACQKQSGLAWHYMAQLYDTLAKENKYAVQNTLALGHWIVHKYVPNTILTNLEPWKKRTRKAEIAAAGAAAAVLAEKKISHSTAHTGAQAAATVTATAHTLTKGATHTGSRVTVIEHTITHDTKVITQVIDVGALPARIGQTITQIRKRLGRAEAWTAAGALSIAMANVLGIPNPRCLRDGPLGKVSRALCGIPGGFLNDLVGLLADFFILENVCMMLPWLETAASDVGTPVVEVLTEIGAGLCAGASAPRALRGPAPSVPALIFGVSASGV